MAVFILVEDDAGTVTEIVAFDVTESENHEHVAVHTENPVEDGADITDHVRVLAHTFSCEVFVTNTPTRNNPFFADRGGQYGVETMILPPAYAEGLRPPVFLPGAGTRALVNLVEGRFSQQVIRATVLQFNTFDTVADTEAKLSAILDAKRPVRLLTTLREYSSLLLVRVSSPVTVENTGGAAFVLDFSEIRTVTADIVTAPIDPAELRGEPKKTRGDNTPIADKEKQGEEARKSFLKQLKDGSGLTGLLGF